MRVMLLGPTRAGHCCCSRCGKRCASATPPPHLLPQLLPNLLSTCAQRLGKWGYLSLGLIAAPPCFILPFFLQPKSEAEKPFAQRYWVKASRTATGTTAAAVWCLAAGAALQPLLPGCRCCRSWRGAATAAAAAALGVMPPCGPCSGHAAARCGAANAAVTLCVVTRRHCTPPCCPAGQCLDRRVLLHWQLLLVSPVLATPCLGCTLCCCWLAYRVAAGFVAAAGLGSGTALLLAAEAYRGRMQASGRRQPNTARLLLLQQQHQQGRCPTFHPSACTWPCYVCRTHYFYRLLGASYTFPAHNLNQARPACLECRGSAAQHLGPARAS